MTTPDNTAPRPDPDYVTPAEAAAILRCHVETIRRAIRAKRLPAVQLQPGGEYKIDRADLMPRPIEPQASTWSRAKGAGDEPTPTEVEQLRIELDEDALAAAHAAGGGE